MGNGFGVAAIDHGLASWSDGISHGESDVLVRFSVPATFRPIGLIGVGYAADSDQPTRRPGRASVARLRL